MDQDSLYFINRLREALGLDPIRGEKNSRKSQNMGERLYADYAGDGNRWVKRKETSS